MKRMALILVLLASLLSAEITLFNSDNSDLPYNSVYGIDFDNFGNIWFQGMENGDGLAQVSMLSRDLSTWTVYQPADLALGDAIADDRAFYMAVDDHNNKWFCTHYGVSVLMNDGTASTVDFSEGAYTRSVQVDDKGNIYLSDRDAAGIYVSADHGTTWELWGAADIGMASGRPEIYDLAVAPDGTLFLLTWYGVFYRDPAGDWHAVTELEGDYTYAMTLDLDGNAWVTDNDTQYLHKVTTAGEVTTYTATDADVLAFAINDLECDAGGMLWLATAGSGLVKLNPIDLSYTVFDSAATEGEIPQDELTVVEIHDNLIWAATEAGGIVRIAGQVDLDDYHLFSADNSDLPYNSVYGIDFDNFGNIWFQGMENGDGLAQVSMLSRDLSTWTVYQPADLALGDAIADDRAFYMAVDDHNNKWFCTHYGASVLMNDGTASTVDFSEGAYTRSVQVDDKGNVYLSDRDAAGIHVSADHGTTWDLWEAADIGMASGRPEIYDLAVAPDGTLFLLTWYGVFYRDPVGDWHAVTELEGDYTYAMTLDLDGNAWVTDNDTQDLHKVTTAGEVTTYTAADAAILASVINDLVCDLDGMLWLATADTGLVQLNPQSLDFAVYDMTVTGGQIPQNEITSIEIRDDVIWAATASGGIVRFRYPESLLPIGIDEQDWTGPVTSLLLGSYPNPFNPQTTLHYYLPHAEGIRLEVFDLQGRLVRTLQHGEQAAGSHQVVWNGQSDDGETQAAGVYLTILQQGARQTVQKLLLVK